MKIVIGIVTRGEDISHGLAQFLFGVTKDVNNEYELFMIRAPLSGNVGNELLFKALETMDFDYAFLTDADVSCEPRAINKLLEVGKDVVVGPVWHYDDNTEDIHLNIHKVEFEKWATIDPNRSRVYYQREGGIDRILSSSFACLLISRRVFDTFRDNKEAYTIDGSPRHVDNIFFQKLNRLGIDVWLRWDIDTVHSRVVELSTKVVDRLIVNVLNSKYLGDAV